MAKKIAVGIDIGTYQIKVVVAEEAENDSLFPRVLGTGFAESKGLRHGYIIDSNDVVRCLSQAIAQAEKTSGVKIKKAFLSVGGMGLGSVSSTGTVIVSRADNEIDELDMSKVMENAEKEIPNSILLNHEIIYAIPVHYKLDGRIVMGNPVGMKGSKFEVKVLSIICLKQHLRELVSAVEEVGVEVVEVMPAPLAAGFVTLSKTQKIAGCVLANIGAETLSLVVYENNKPISLEIFSMGSTDITNDIALGFKIPIEEAEHIKLGGLTTANYPKKKLEEIIEARLGDMFDLIEAHLKKIGRSGLLPAGIIITGGGGGISFIEELARHTLRLPSKVASIVLADNKSPFKDPSWSVSYGLCVFGLNTLHLDTINTLDWRKWLKKIINFVKQFLP